MTYRKNIRVNRVIESQVEYVRLEKRRTKKTFGVSVTRIEPTPLVTTTSLRDDRLVRAYKHGLALCNEGACNCICNCHMGSDCDETTRIHTPGHKPVWHTVRDSLTGIRSRIEVTCHDCDLTKLRFHSRQSNEAHKRTHRECTGHSYKHNRK